MQPEFKHVIDKLGTFNPNVETKEKNLPERSLPLSCISNGHGDGDENESGKDIKESQERTVQL